MEWGNNLLDAMTKYIFLSFIWWTCLSVVFHGITRATSAQPPAEKSPPGKLCDLHLWYLDRVADGSFDGPQNLVQRNLKIRIDKLIARARGTPSAGQISCTTLATFENMLGPSAGSSSNSGAHVGGTRAENDSDGDGERRGKEAGDVNHGSKSDGGDVDVGETESHHLREDDIAVLSGREKGEDDSDREGIEVKTASGKEHEDGHGGDVPETAIEGESSIDETEVTDDDITDDDDDSEKRWLEEATSDEAKDEAEVETTETIQSAIESSSPKHDSITGSVKTQARRWFNPFLPVCRRKRKMCEFSEYLFSTLSQQHYSVHNPATLTLLDYCKTSFESHVRRKRRQRGRGYRSTVRCYYFHIMDGVQKSGDLGVRRKSALHEIQKVCSLVRKCDSLCFYASHFRRVCMEHYYGKQHTKSASEEGDTSAGEDRNENDTKTAYDETTTGSDDTALDDKETYEEKENEDNEGEPTDTTSENNLSDDSPKDTGRDSVGDTDSDEHDNETVDTNTGDADEIVLAGAEHSDVEDGTEPEGKNQREEQLTDSVGPSVDFTDGVDTQKHPTTTKISGERTHDEKSYSSESSESKRAKLLEEEFRMIEEKYQQKTSEQSAKLQSLELLVTKLENQILSQKLDDQNSTSQIVYLENQILRIENELLKMNQSHVALMEENRILTSRQNKYLAIDHKGQEEKNNSSKYFELVTAQQQKLGLLNELLRNQSSALLALQQRSDHLEEQNQLLHQIIINQTALVSHVMQKLMEVSEQNMKNQHDMNQLKSAMDTQLASRDIIHKIENMLEEASDKGMSPSATESRSSSILRFASTMLQFSEEAKHLTCAGKRRPRFCFNFVILISPCPPFKLLSWGHCPNTLKEIKLTPEQGPPMNTQEKGSNLENGVPETAEIPGTVPKSASDTVTLELKDKDENNIDKKVSERADSAAPLGGFPSPNAADDGNKPEEDERSQQAEKHVVREQIDSNPVYQNKKTETDSEVSVEHRKVLPEGVDARDDMNPAHRAISHSEKLGVSEQGQTIDMWDYNGKPLEPKSVADVGAKQRGSDAREVDDVGKDRGEEKKEEEDKEKKEEEQEANRKKLDKNAHLKKQMLEAKAKRRAEAEKMKKEKTAMAQKKQQAAMMKKKQEEEAMAKKKMEEDAMMKKKLEEEALKKRKQEAEAAKKKQEAELMATKIKEAETRHSLYWSSDKRKPEDCYELYKRSGPARNGAYKVFVQGLKLYVSVFCDMKAGGWTVIMKREDGTLDFFRGWSDYVNGFGTPFSEHYVGNEVIHYLTNQNQYSLQVDLKDWEGNTRTATYQHFWIDDENENFKLHVLGYNGTAGDGLGKHDSMAFSTNDRDNDLLPANQMGGSCARRFHGAGWYYKCYTSNLFGAHYVDGVVPEKKFDGVAWKPWTGPNYSLKEVVLKIRPRGAE